MIRKLNNLLLAASAVAALVAFVKRNDLPANLAVRNELAAEPRQTPTAEQPFSVSYANVAYKIEPQFEYDLYGLVVSYRLHDGNSTMHRRARDHLNVADVCVVWSDTAASPTLRKIDFWNGVFTCNFSTRDAEAWARFKTNQVSNNHLLSADEWTRRQIDGVRIGDQIHVRGLLASYASPGGKRGTSTTRDDQGDGACETIFVRDFAVLEPAHSSWRFALYAALAALALGLVVHFRLPYRPYAD
ncbi:MAG TPA: hypothetical protein VFO94_18980 [Gammaproteobacteria bacterium]|nr:hypothetical protein [Gammaproteobacteria bacterium]